MPVFSVVYMLIWRFVDARLAARGMPLELVSYSAPDSPIPQGSKKQKPARRGAPGMLRGAHVSRIGPPRRKKNGRAGGRLRREGKRLDRCVNKL